MIDKELEGELMIIKGVMAQNLEPDKQRIIKIVTLNLIQGLIPPDDLDDQRCAFPPPLPAKGKGAWVGVRIFS